MDPSEVWFDGFATWQGCGGGGVEWGGAGGGTVKLVGHGEQIDNGGTQ